jgi:hypothetical protein
LNSSERHEILDANDEAVNEMTIVMSVDEITQLIKQGLDRATNCPNLVSVVSYNVHGLNQGAPGIKYMVDLFTPDIFLNIRTLVDN